MVCSSLVESVINMTYIFSEHCGMSVIRVQMRRSYVTCTREKHHAQELILPLVTHIAVDSYPQLLWKNIVSEHAMSHARADLRKEPSP